MTTKYKTILLILMTVIFTSCNPGYEKVENKWAYVTFDEGSGKRTNFLDIDESTFEILKDNEFAKDKSKVFFQGNQIYHADSRTFIVTGNGYSKDDFNVFLDCETVVDANPKTFIQLDFPYSRDNNHIYCGTIPLAVNDIENFKVTKGSGMQTSELTTTFIKDNPEYSFIDTLKYKVVIYGEGQAETSTEIFVGYRKKK